MEEVLEFKGNRFSIGPRPRKKKLPNYREFGVTDIVTLLSEKEEAEAHGKLIEDAGIRWHWYPMNGAKPANLIPEEFKQNIIGFCNALQAHDCRHFYIH